MGNSFAKILLLIVLIVALAVPATAQVFVNEVTANSANDYVELFYNGTSSVSLANFRVNSSTNLGSALSGTLSTTSRYATFTEAQLGYNLVNADTLTLVNTTSGNPTNTFTYTGLTPSNSAGRIPDGTGTVNTINNPTPSAQNNNNPTFSITTTLTFNEDTNGTINLGLYASDPEDANVNLTYSASPASNLTISINQNTKVATIAPDADWFGTRNIIFFCIDTNGGIASSTLSVTVNPVNDAPALNFTPMNNATLTTNEDTVATFNIGAYASDVEDAVANLTFGVQGTPTGITVGINQTTDIVTITPNANWFGSQTVIFTVTDTNSAVGTAAITVNVTSVNDVPVMNLSAINPININEDGSANIVLSTYTTDVEQAASSLTYTSGNIANVTITINQATDTATITPDADWNGQRVLTFIAQDSNSGTGVDTITLNVSAVNDAPRWNFSAINNTLIFNENTNGTLNLGNYVTDLEEALANLTLSFTPVANINITINQTTKVATFVPDANFTGQRNVTFSAMDTQNATGNGVLTVNVNNTNNPPVFSFTNVTFAEDTNYTLDVGSAVTDDRDADANLTIAHTASPGITVVYNHTTFNATITPDANFTGLAHINWTATDLNSGVGNGTVNINVTQVNDFPLFSFAPINNSVHIFEDGNTTINLSTYASDVEDPDANLNYTVTSMTPATGLNVLINQTSKMVYIAPDPNVHGMFNVTFNVSDTMGGTAVDYLDINVSGQNDIPQVNFSQSPLNGTLTFNEDVNTTLDIFPYISDNETLFENLTINITQVPNMEINLTNHNATEAIVLFKPDHNWHGQRNVTFTVEDKNGGIGTGILTVNVISINDPILFNGTIPTQFFFSGQSKVIDLSTYFIDEDNLTTLIYDTPQKDANITVSFNSAAQTATISAAAGYSGISNLTINATDGINETAISNSFYVQALPYNNPPVITAFPNVVMNEDSYNSTIDLDNYVSDNDTQASAMTWYVSPNPNVFVSINPTTHMINITTKQNFAGNETLAFTVSDGTSTDTRNMSIEVLNTDNDPPVIPTLISPADAAVVSDQSMQVNLQWSSYDPDNTPLTYSVYFGTDQNPPHYIDTTNSNLTVNLTDDTTYYWYVIATDGVHTTNKSATFSFRTDAPNFAPEITAFTPAGTTVDVNEGQNQTFTPTVRDLDNDPLEYQWTLDGTVVSTDQNYTYSPGFNDAGTKSLSFKVTDTNSGQYASQTITVNVIDVQPQFSLQSTQPSSNNILIRQGASQTFSVILNNPTHLPTTYKWFVNGNEESQADTFTLNTADRGNGPFTVSYEARNDQGNVVTYSWTVQTANRPTSRSGRIRGTIISVPDSELSHATNVTIEVPNVAKIDFGPATVDLTNVIDLDSFVVLDTNIAGIDTTQFSALNLPATITLYGISYDETPIINYTTAFTTDRSQVNAPYASATLVSYSPAPTAHGTVVFTVSGFSTYNVGNTVEMGPRLEIDDLEIAGDRVRIDPNGRDKVRRIKPGDRIEIEMEVKNTFPRRNGLEIEGIEVEVTIFDIDDGDDLNFDSDRDFDLDPDDEEDVRLDFRVPYEVEDGEEYEILIEVDGIDEHGFRHRVTTRAFLEIEKDKHNIKLTELNLRPSRVSCTRVTNLELEMTNLGEDDEDNAKVTVVNEELGIDESYTFDLDSDPYDEDFDIRKNFILNIPEDAEPKVYDIIVSTYYDRVRLSESRSVQLSVQDCEDKSYQTYTGAPVAQPSPVDVQIIDSGKQPMITTEKDVDSNTKSVLVMLIIIGALLVVIMLVYMFAGNNPQARAQRDKKNAWKKYQKDMRQHAEAERRRRMMQMQKEREQNYTDFRRKQWEEFKKRQQEGRKGFGGR
ncbi:MAG: tandem-95 repeat protein [Nanoarchaeota archaeon]|nr:tandem-95 repeat protein [Nanoarchaeota archaeon]